MPRRIAVRALLALLFIAPCACDRYAPDTIPKDPGTVAATVMDQSQRPMPGVWVHVHDIPNAIGSTFSIGAPTKAAGVATIEEVPAGTRRVEVTPPAGYTAVQPVISIEVVKSRVVPVVFTLTKD